MPADASFQLDPRLAADTVAVTALPLSRVLLMNDQTYPWLILVPQRPGMADMIDLSSDDQHRLTDEIALTAQVLKNLFKPIKLNIASLGNMVRQLHVHVIARYETDHAWPAPVWGKAPATPYAAADATALVSRLRAAFEGGQPA